MAMHKTLSKKTLFRLSGAIRVLSAETIEKAKSGHPGIVLGFSDVFTVLVHNFLKFIPEDPNWFNRDRLILSSGHGSMLLYSFYYLTGYKNYSLEEIKNFRQLGSNTPGHPEWNKDNPIEATTGPLGQGFGNSLGFAIAEKKYKTEIGKDLCNHKIYAIVSDGCLMEGIGYEAMSLAGHLRLNNLIVLYDDNEITIDGRTDLSSSEDHIEKFIACGWNAERIDGHDIEQIIGSLSRAQNSDKPYLIACRTIIGYGANLKAGSEDAHGAPLGESEISALKKFLNWPDKKFFIPENLMSLWRSCWRRNQKIYQKWQEDFDKTSWQKEYIKNEPIISPNLCSINLCELQLPRFSSISIARSVFASNSEATRTSSGRVIEYLLSSSKGNINDKITNDKIIIGSADLSLSNKVKTGSAKAITKDDFSGNYIHYGIRENLMGAILNGLTLSGFLAIGGTFLVFSDYMRPSIRLAALMKLRVIYVMTHDSIGVGEDGPTHQPIEQLASFRAMVNLYVIRPADNMETIEAWQIALSIKDSPVLLSLTRQKLPQIRSLGSSKNYSSFGAYSLQHAIQDNYKGLAIRNDMRADVGIFASGSEVSLALEVKAILKKNGYKVRVISIPCFEIFFEQEEQYISKLLSGYKIKIGIEAASKLGWERIIGEDGLFFGMEDFGASAPYKDIYKYYKLTSNDISDKIINALESIQ